MSGAANRKDDSGSAGGAASGAGASPGGGDSPAGTVSCVRFRIAVRPAPGEHRAAGDEHLFHLRSILCEVEAEVRERQPFKLRRVGVLADAADAEVVDAELAQVEREPGAGIAGREVVIAIEAEHAGRHVEAGGLAHVTPVLRRLEVCESEAPFRGEWRQRHLAAPVERRAAARLRVQVVGVVGVRRGAEVPQLQAERLKVRGVARCERAVLEVRVAVGHAEERDEEARRALVFRIVLGCFRKGLREVREVELAARADHRADVGPADRDFLEARAGAPQARKSQVDEQRVEARERLAVRVRKAEAVHLERKGERVEAHLADRERAPVILVRELLRLAADQPGH